MRRYVGEELPHQSSANAAPTLCGRHVHPPELHECAHILRADVAHSPIDLPRKPEAAASGLVNLSEMVVVPLWVIATHWLGFKGNACRVEVDAVLGELLEAQRPQAAPGSWLERADLDRRNHRMLLYDRDWSSRTR